jgi:chromosome segregation ATPase
MGVRVEEVESENLVYKRNLNMFQKENYRLTDTLNELTSEYNAVKLEHATTLNELTLMSDRLKEELYVDKHESARMKTCMEGLAVENTRVKNAMEDIRGKYDLLKRNYDGVDNENVRLLEKLQITNDDMAKLKVLADESMSIKQELFLSNVTRDTSLKETEALRDVVTELRGIREERDSAVAKFDTLTKENNKYKKEVKNKLEEAEKIKKTFEEDKARVLELEGIKDAHDGVVAELDALRRDYDAAQAQNAELNDQLNDKNGVLKGIDEALLRLTNDGLYGEPMPPTPPPNNASSVMSPLRPRGASTLQTTAKTSKPQPLPLPTLRAHDVLKYTPSDDVARDYWDGKIKPLVETILTLREDIKEVDALHKGIVKEKESGGKVADQLSEKLKDANGLLALAKSDVENYESKLKQLQTEKSATLKAVRSVVNLTGKTFRNLRKADEIGDVKSKQEFLLSIRVGMSKLESVCRHKPAVDGDSDGDDGDDTTSGGGKNRGFETVTALDGVVECILKAFQHDLKLNDLFCDALSTVETLKTELVGEREEKKGVEAELEALGKKFRVQGDEIERVNSNKASMESANVEYSSFICDVIDSVKETVDYEMQQHNRQPLVQQKSQSSPGRNRGRTASSFNSSNSNTVSLKQAIQTLESTVDGAMETFRSLSAAHGSLHETSEGHAAKLKEVEVKHGEASSETKSLRDHYENLIQEIRAENVVAVTEAEHKESMRREQMTKQLESQMRSMVQRNKELERDLQSTRSDAVTHMRDKEGVSEKFHNESATVKRMSKALRVCIRAIPPMIRRIDELRNEKRMLWSMVKEAWKWEAELRHLATASTKPPSKQNRGASVVSLRTVTLRSAVIAVIALNRLKIIGREGKLSRGAYHGSDSTPSSRRQSDAPMQTPPVGTRYSGENFSALSGDVSFFTPQQYQLSAPRRTRTSSQVVDLLPSHDIEDDFSELPDLNMDDGGGGGGGVSAGASDMSMVESVVNSVVKGDAKIGSIHAWEQLNNNLVRDLSRGLFSWMRRGNRINARGGDAIGNVRRGMGVMARKVLELEEYSTNSKELRGKEREEFNNLKEYNAQLVELLNSEKKAAAELEEAHNAAAARLEGSVPLKRLTAMQEELKHSKKMHMDVIKKYGTLEAQYLEKEKALESERSILNVVREEVHRTNAELEDERRAKKGVEEEVVRLRTLSEQLQSGDVKSKGKR